MQADAQLRILLNLRRFAQDKQSRVGLGHSVGRDGPGRFGFAVDGFANLLVARGQISDGTRKFKFLRLAALAFRIGGGDFRLELRKLKAPVIGARAALVRQRRVRQRLKPDGRQRAWLEFEGRFVNVFFGIGSFRQHRLIAKDFELRAVG